MEHIVCSSRKDEWLSNDPNIEYNHEVLNSYHEEIPPLFLDFPSTFFDGISTTPINTNNHTNLYHLNSPNKPANIIELELEPEPEPEPCESKRLKKRSGGGKKDRHSKIHTAQGLRDRRMRLSLHIARKFFDLQDLLGFDKASKTIEWLFCKSNKAIKEVAKNFSPQHTNQLMSEENCVIELISENKTATNNPANSKNKKESKNKELRMKQIPNKTRLRETRNRARARARDRTREKLMIKELERSRQLFGGNPREEIYKLGLGYLASPNIHNVEELGFISSPSELIQQDSSSPSLENSHAHHLVLDSQSIEHTNVLSNISLKAGCWGSEMMGNISSIPKDTEVAPGIPKSQPTPNYLNTFENMGTSTTCSTVINNHPPAGWLNSWTGFLPGEWDADTFANEYYNYGVVPTTVALTDDIYEQNPSSFIMSTTNILHVQSQNQDR